ncbi:MAG TPA: DUF6174 domain-containing protein, partial [Herpetosiphonaceae bacterium]|nr:DUF6174 domain-containing protein [Herpetosiphonaceae bacterium]
WERQEIENYRITTAFLSLGSDITVTVVVRDGQVAEHECAPEPTENNSGCEQARKNPARYTVPGLFAELRQLHRDAQRSTAYLTPYQAIGYSYHSELGYPKQIAWNPPEYTKWTVKSFERLP